MPDFSCSGLNVYLRGAKIIIRNADQGMPYYQVVINLSINREFTQRQEYDYVNGCLKGLGLIVIVIVIVSWPYSKTCRFKTAEIKKRVWW